MLGKGHQLILSSPTSPESAELLCLGIEHRPTPAPPVSRYGWSSCDQTALFTLKCALHRAACAVDNARRKHFV